MQERATTIAIAIVGRANTIVREIEERSKEIKAKINQITLRAIILQGAKEKKI